MYFRQKFRLLSPAGQVLASLQFLVHGREVDLLQLAAPPRPGWLPVEPFLQLGLVQIRRQWPGHASLACQTQQFVDRSRGQRARAGDLPLRANAFEVQPQEFLNRMRNSRFSHRELLPGEGIRPFGSWPRHSDSMSYATGSAFTMIRNDRSQSPGICTRRRQNQASMKARSARRIGSRGTGNKSPEIVEPDGKRLLLDCGPPETPSGRFSWSTLT